MKLRVKTDRTQFELREDSNSQQAAKMDKIAADAMEEMGRLIEADKSTMEDRITRADKTQTTLITKTGIVNVQQIIRIEEV